MKQIISTLLLLFTVGYAYCEPIEYSDSTKIESDSLIRVETKSVAELWDAANTAYIRSDYNGALNIYNEILAQDMVSAKLFYNMGNAYYKSGELGRAILYYNRALRLSPSDEDIRHNLSIAQSMCIDRIETIPEFFITRWMHNLRSQMSGNWWCITSLIILSLSICDGLLYLLSERITLRKVGFFATLFGIILLIITTSLSAKDLRETKEQSRAIILSGAVSVKSSPDNSATDLFVLHEGTELTLGEKIGSWREIRLSDGKKGWVESRHFEAI